MTRVLSFDVGTKNLSWCDLSVKATGDFEVNAWAVVNTVAAGINVNKTPVWDLAPPFYDYLQKTAHSWLFDGTVPKAIDRVLIENQPMGGRGAARNLKTKVLSHILQCVILGLRPDLTVAFVHPGLKLKDMPLADATRKNTYRENKTYAIEATAAMVASEKCLTKAFCSEIYGAKKKDDLADAFLQGLYVAGAMARGDVVGSVDVPKIAKIETGPKKRKAKDISKDIKKKTDAAEAKADAVADSNKADSVLEADAVADTSSKKSASRKKAKIQDVVASEPIPLVPSVPLLSSVAPVAPFIGPLMEAETVTESPAPTKSKAKRVSPKK